MPEGDTVHKLAVFLDAALRGQAVNAIRLHPAFGASRSGPVAVSGVSCKGKHLYLALADGMTLRSHLGLYGSWHRYRPGAPWRKPARQASILIETASWRFVCFNAKAAEWLRTGGLREADGLARLGPDLIAQPPDAAAWGQRALALAAPDTPLVDLLLDQRIAAGIGNVYKSELLFLERLSPRLTRGQVDPSQLARLYRRAALLLRANLGGGARTTRHNLDGRGVLWVYGRRGLPCLRCGALIRRALLGSTGGPRSTYWCEACQPSDQRSGPG